MNRRLPRQLTREPRQHPQEPTGQRYRLSGALAYPETAALSELNIQSKVLELIYSGAVRSSPLTIRRLADEISVRSGSLVAEYSAFDDRLTRYAPSLNSQNWQAAIAKSLQEYSAYQRIIKKGDTLPPTFSDFLKLLSEAHARLGRGLTTVRTRPVFIVPDTRGNITEFPPADQCEELLHNLYSFLSSRLNQDPAICSLVAYATAIYVHPFTDGNGGTARVLYNLVNAFGMKERHFVPLYTVSMINRANLLIRLRRVFFAGDWLSLQQFFSDALALSARVQKTGSD